MTDIPSIAEAGAAMLQAASRPSLSPRPAWLESINMKRVHSFIRLERDRALSAARTAEAEIKAGRRCGDLHGIPFACKDIYQTAGIPTTAHSKLLIEHVPTRDATTVTKLAEAGIVSFGKLGDARIRDWWPELRLALSTAPQSVIERALHGWLLERHGRGCGPELRPRRHRSDTGGSIRTPSAFCGLSGIKPTYGLVSRTGILPLSFTLDHAGPMAWTVEDCAILLQAMVGHDRADPASANQPIPDYRLTGAFTLIFIKVAGWTFLLMSSGPFNE